MRSASLFFVNCTSQYRVICSLCLVFVALSSHKLAVKEAAKWAMLPLIFNPVQTKIPTVLTFVFLLISYNIKVTRLQSVLQNNFSVQKFQPNVCDPRPLDSLPTSFVCSGRLLLTKSDHMIRKVHLSLFDLQLHLHSSSPLIYLPITLDELVPWLLLDMGELPAPVPTCFELVDMGLVPASVHTCCCCRDSD